MMLESNNVDEAKECIVPWSHAGGVPEGHLIVNFKLWRIGIQNKFEGSFRNETRTPIDAT